MSLVNDSAQVYDLIPAILLMTPHDSQVFIFKKFRFSFRFQGRKCFFLFGWRLLAKCKPKIADWVKSLNPNAYYTIFHNAQSRPMVTAEEIISAEFTSQYHC